MKTLVIVDAQNDFISGSLACQGSEEALKNIVSYIECDPDMDVVYTADWHSKMNGSFKENGGHLAGSLCGRYGRRRALRGVLRTQERRRAPQ